MSQFWYTNAGRQFIEGTMPQIARHLNRIAYALESMTMAKDNIMSPYPLCEWCDHRHFVNMDCSADDCECKE